MWENIPKLLLSHVICSISLSALLKRLPIGGNPKEIFAYDEIRKRIVVLGHLECICWLFEFVRTKRHIKYPIIFILLTLLILQPVIIIIKCGLVALHGCKKVCIDFCTSAAPSGITFAFYFWFSLCLYIMILLIINYILLLFFFLKVFLGSYWVVTLFCLKAVLFYA